MTMLSDSTSKGNDRSFEVVGMEKLIPSIRSRKYKDGANDTTEYRTGIVRWTKSSSSRDKTSTVEMFGNLDSLTSIDHDKESKKSKKNSKIKSTFNSVLRSIRSGADKLLTNFLSSGNYNRLIIATSAAMGVAKGSAISDADDKDGKIINGSTFGCGPQLTLSLSSNNSKNKLGYNKLETDDLDGDDGCPSEGEI